MAEHDSRTGLLYALAGFALLSVGDAVIKTMAGQWSPIAVAALRFVFGAIGLSALLLVQQGPPAFRPRRPWLQFGRGLCLAMATIGFFSAVFLMPLAEATSLIFVAPIITAILSGPILKERVPRITWLASLAAFGGVMLILRPNFLELGWAACLPLGSALFMSLLVLANRAVARDGSALSMQVFMAGVAAPTLIMAAAAGHFSGEAILSIGVPDWTVIARCALVAVTASTAHWLVFIGTTKAGAATIAPMTYVQILVAASLGWLWFGDVPDIATFAGAGIIIAAGLMLWYAGRPPTLPISD